MAYVNITYIYEELDKSDHWFGKRCKHQCCQWEDSEEIAGPDWKEYNPVLIYCNHTDNPSETEGNCTELRCPEYWGVIDTAWRRTTDE